MSVGGRDDGSGGVSRRRFLALGAAGVSVLALGGYTAAAFGQSAGEAITYKGREIAVRRVADRAGRARPELYIDGDHVVTVNNNGTYRAASYAFDWSDSLQALGRKMVDNRVALAAEARR